MRRKYRHLLILAFCPLFLLLMYVGAFGLKRAIVLRRVQRIIIWGELAPLPKSATEIKSCSRAFLSTGMHFLRFRARQADIEAFFRESPILKGADWTIYSKEKQRLIDPDYGSGTIEINQDANAYFYPRNCSPSWYLPEIHGAGRGYRFKTKQNNFTGEVIIDEEKKIVFVSLFFG